jgi:redox-sensitive bicupin YhaK (pirin superfamily)
VEGELKANGTKLRAGDALYGEDEDSLELQSDTDSEFLLFDIGKGREPA